LIANGGFEGGLAGWTVFDQAGGTGTWFATGALTTPTSGHPTVGPKSGAAYAVSDQPGPGAHALTQQFVVAPGSLVQLSFDMFVNNWGVATSVNPAGLDYTASPNQHGRVDILAAGSAPLSTTVGLLQNFYTGADTIGAAGPYKPYSFDITPLVGGGGTFLLRFAEVDNQLWFNQGVDNVSILAEVIPEPLTMLAVALGAGSLGGYLRRRRAC
jgi:hypothetical protein